MLKRLLKILITIMVMFINNYVYADINDSTLLKNRYENVYAVYDGPDRIHLYYGERFTLNGITAYCIEPGLKIDTNTYSSTEDWQITNLSTDVRNKVRLIAYYGYDYPNHNTMKYYLATQELIWREITKRNVYWVNEEDINGPRINIDTEKQTILAMVNNHAKTPSFDNQTIEVNLGEEKIIQDDNGVLDDYEIYESNINDVQIDGNKLKINAQKNIQLAQIKLIRKHYTNSTALIYYSGNNQKMIRSGILDPVVAIANVNVMIKTKIKVIKIDKDYNYTIKKNNIKFKIKNLDTGEYICETSDCLFITDELGSFITDMLGSGHYQLEEIENQDVYGYVWNSKPVVFNIDDKSQIIYENETPIMNIKFPNKQVRGNIKVFKVGEKPVIKDSRLTYEEIPLEVTYSLYADENIYAADGSIVYKKNQIIISFPVTNGVREIQNLPLGKFCLKEISTVENYLLPVEPYCFSFEYKDRYTPELKKEIHLKNYLAKGSFILTKNDSLTNMPLSNAHIMIYTQNDELIYEGDTDNDGQLSVSNIPLGKYYYREEVAPIGYILDNDKHYFEIKTNEETITETILNEQITGTFEFFKTDYATNLPLPNTEIEIYNEENKLLYIGSTNELGKIIIENIPYGKYYFIEKKAPTGYMIDNNKYYFEIKENNTIIKANMTNERIKVPNTFFNEANLIYLVSLVGIILSIVLFTRKAIFLKLVGIILLVISIGIPIYKIESQEKQIKVSKTAIKNYIVNTSQSNEKITTNKRLQPIYNYIAILEIPSIELKKGLVNKYSKYNDVKYNIQIIDGSSMPDIVNSNLILAAHSGNSDVSYFKDLTKLATDDEVYVYYNGIKYYYKISNHYEVKKTGYIDIERDRTINAITLITCKDDDYQAVYLGYLINKEAY